MTSRPQRDEWTGFVRQRAAGLRGWLVRRFWQPIVQGVHQLLNRVLRTLPSSRVLYAIGKPICFLGCISGVGWPLTGLVSAWTTGFQLPTTEFPLGDPTHVAVDSHGRFYVVDSLHLRVERYSPNGEFERGWFVPRKIFAALTTPDDRVIVGAEGGPRTYSPDGELLEVNPDEGELRRLGLVRGKEPTGPYAVHRGLIPRIVDKGTGETVIATPWPLRLVGSPFPAFVYFFGGVAIIVLGDARRRHERRAPDRPVPTT